MESAAADFVRRASAGLVGFHSGDDRIRVHAPDSPGRPEGIGEWPIPLRRPGYADRGGLALVRLSLPWGIHSATGTWVLVVSGGAWRVLLREIVYHP